MAGNSRNASVVIALVVSMTLGLLMLLWLEHALVPARRDFSGSALLMAQRGMQVSSVDIAYAASWDDVPALGITADTTDSVCLITPDGEVQWAERGPHVRLIVIGTDGATAERLNDEQKRKLLDVLGTLSGVSGQGLVPVRFEPDHLASANSPAAAQVADLRDFLVLKGFIGATPQ